MTGPKQKPGSAKRRRTIRPRDRQCGTYVYCIVESNGLEGVFDAAPEGLESGLKLEPEVSGSFAAVVSTVPLSEYGERALEANLADVNWAASRAMRHERVVEYFASRRAVIPLRFGAIYIDRRSIGRMLAERADEFKPVMERLRGKEEWGVYVYCDRAKLIENKVSNNPAIRQLLNRAASAPPGQSYLLSKQIEGLKAEAARDEISGAVGQIKQALDASSQRSARIPQAGRQQTEQGELVAKLSFLVETDRFDHFRASAERLAEMYLSSGFHIELAGPLPPYNFVVDAGALASAH
jgi:hypothetical protein